MKNKILVALLSLGLSTTAVPKKAEAGAVGFVWFGTVSLLINAFDGDATGQWVLTGLSAGAVVGGVALAAHGSGILGTAIILLDSEDAVPPSTLEQYLVMTYPEIDDREWIAELAAAASESATISDSRISGMPHIRGAKTLNIQMDGAKLQALLRQTALKTETIERLKTDLL